MANTIPETTRELAALMAIVSIALVGTTFVIIPTVWKRLNERLKDLSHSQKRITKITALFVFTPIVLLIGAATIAGIYCPDFVQEAVLLVLASLTAVSLVYLLVQGIKKIAAKVKGKKETKPPRADTECLFYTMTLFYLGGTVSFSLFALLLVSPLMLDIELGPYNPENFEGAKWFLSDAIFFFVVGIITFGIAYITSKPKNASTQTR